MIATYMKDVASKAYVHNLEGAFENEIELPGLGSASGFGGNMDDTSLFYTFTSFTYPTSIFRYDVAARKSSLFRAPEIPGLDVNQYETKQVFVTSKDGAKVPMFLVHKKGLALDGNNPTLMYGYGGFNIATTPGLQLAAHCAARAGLRLRQRQHARRQRVRRGVARRRHQAEEAERVRRLHRRGRMADREQVHVTRRSWRRRAARTAACWSAP